MTDNEHRCEDCLAERMSTPENPYCYVGSGLPNVFLTGVKYYVCQTCGTQSAEIPALKQLLAEIARTVVQKASPLTGAQARFLRKRLNRKSKDFARMISLTPERYSAIETSDDERMDPARDKLVRVIYRIMSGDRKLKTTVEREQQFERWITSIEGEGTGERIVATWLKNHQWRVETEVIAA
jgi:DNA-binding transcriptional regulator YiaG